MELFGHSRSPFVWRKKNGAYNQKCTVPRMKLGGGRLMFWGSFAARGPGPHICFKGNMIKDIYRQILHDNSKEPARALRLER